MKNWASTNHLSELRTDVVKSTAPAKAKGKPKENQRKTHKGFPPGSTWIHLDLSGTGSTVRLRCFRFPDLSKPLSNCFLAWKRRQKSAKHALRNAKQCESTRASAMNKFEWCKAIVIHVANQCKCGKVRSQVISNHNPHVFGKRPFGHLEGAGAGHHWDQMVIKYPKMTIEIAPKVLKHDNAEGVNKRPEPQKMERCKDRRPHKLKGNPNEKGSRSHSQHATMPYLVLNSDGLLSAQRTWEQRSHPLSHWLYAKCMGISRQNDQMPMVPYGAHSPTPKMHGNLADVAPPIKKGLSERLAGVEGPRRPRRPQVLFGSSMRNPSEQVVNKLLTMVLCETLEMSRNEREKRVQKNHLLEKVVHKVSLIGLTWPKWPSTKILRYSQRGIHKQIWYHMNPCLPGSYFCPLMEAT